MKVKKTFAIKAESFVEEQYLIENLPGAIWHQNLSGEFHTFYINENEEPRLKKALKKWDDLNKIVNKKKKSEDG
jgi:hypothetical protein